MPGPEKPKQDRTKKGLASGPLSGYRVLELSSTVAGPFCGRLLADFGAEVIKVEPPEGDPIRTMGKHCAGNSLYAASILRNKKLIAVDLRRPEGQDIIRRLARHCDVLVENFRPGTLERWGLGWADLSTHTPDLVMVRISGFGQTGPYHDRPGYGVTSEAVSGLRYITGDPDRPPARVAVSLTDYITGLYGAFGAMMALLQRERDGRGQLVDTALYESAFSFMEPHVPAYDKLGVIAERRGPNLADHNPNTLYPTRDGEYIHVTAASQTIFGRLVRLMGQEELATDARFTNPLKRSENTKVLDEIIANWTRQHDLVPLEQMLIDAEIPASRIYTMADIFHDDHFHAREMLLKIAHSSLSTVTVPGIVPKLSSTPGAVRWAGRRLGENTAEVLTDLADISIENLKRLSVSGIIRCEPAETERKHEQGNSAASPVGSSEGTGS